MGTTLVVVVVEMTSAMRSRSQRGYDRLAPCYRSIERLVFGDQLQRARVALLEHLPPWKQLLILGDGDGRLLAQLQAPAISNPTTSTSPSAPSRRIVSVDQSRRMLDQQRTRIESPSHAALSVEFIQADARHYIPQARTFDVIAAAFFLDCFTQAELEQFLPRWLSGLADHGILYYVDFVIPTQPRQQRQAKFWLWMMHQFFRWQTGLANRQLVDTYQLLQNCGLGKHSETRSASGMITTQLWRALPRAQSIGTV